MKGRGSRSPQPSEIEQKMEAMVGGSPSTSSDGGLSRVTDWLDQVGPVLWNRRPQTVSQMRHLVDTITVSLFCVCQMFFKGKLLDHENERECGTCERECGTM